MDRLCLGLQLFCVLVGAAPHCTDAIVPWFTISNLSVRAVPLSHRVEYVLFVQTDPSCGMAQCSALMTNLNESLANVPLTSCSPGSSVAFQWRQFDDGSAELKVVHNVSARPSAFQQAGARRIGKRDIRIMGNGTEFKHQAYVGPVNFSIPATIGT